MNGGMAMKKAINTTLDRDLLVQAKKTAQKRRISVSAIMERALDRYLALLEAENHERGNGDGKERPK
jgi:post-segregation antitoxin (ccd killing protein)